MMGKRSPQAPIFAAGRLYPDYVGRDTLYGITYPNRLLCSMECIP